MSRFLIILTAFFMYAASASAQVAPLDDDASEKAPPSCFLAGFIPSGANCLGIYFQVPFTGVGCIHLTPIPAGTTNFTAYCAATLPTPSSVTGTLNIVPCPC